LTEAGEPGAPKCPGLTGLIFPPEPLSEEAAVTTTDIEVRRTGGQPQCCRREAELVHVREQRKPWTAMGLILLAASAERMAAHLTGEEQALAYGTAVLAFACAVVLGFRSRHRLMGKHLRRRFIAAVWGSAGWLTYVAACGLTWGAAATLTTVGSLLSLLFWREHRVYGRSRHPRRWRWSRPLRTTCS
jgi:hypothetical protein